MEEKDEILKKLLAIQDNEWQIIIKKLANHVRYRLKGKILFGAHSEQNLYFEPINYYVDGAIEKLFSLDWKWKFDKYTLDEELKRVANSMISESVRKYRVKKDRNEIPLLIDQQQIEASCGIEDEEYSEEDYSIFREALDKCSEDDEDLQLYVMALSDCKSFDEIENITGFEKKKIYSLQKKLTRRIESYLQKTTKNGNNNK